MNLGWQDLVALAIVFAAAGYLARLAWGAVSRKAESGCGTGCGKCSAGANASMPRPEQVLSIGLMPRVSVREDEATVGSKAIQGSAGASPSR